jgi:hypothetical protein
MTRRFRFLIPLVSVLVHFGAPNLATAEASSSAAIVPARLALQVNILGLATLNPTLDLEAALTHGFTLGATAWWEVREVQDRWGQIRLTYYPGGIPMKGLAFALTGGVHRAYRESDADTTIRPEDTSLTAGLLANYGFRFGKSEHLMLAIVAGVKSVLTTPGADSPLQPFYIEARLNLGWVF